MKKRQAKTQVHQTKTTINNGFTLVELLCVIVIISVLSVIVVPNFIKILSDNKKEISEVQKNMIISSAKLFYEDCSHNSETLEFDCNSMLNENNGIYEIKLEDLVDKGYIDQVKVDNNICSGVIIKDKNKYDVNLNCK